ncbi:MAG: helix-turn-helix domain-containing protein [Ardenticatenales bacterium]|nr:helix-turn-helix domain-containing protein [Ardenticatenales bacterium]
MSTNFYPIFNPDEWISQAEVARLRGVSRQAIYNLIKRGRISTLKIGGHIFVRRAEIESFEPQEPGRPRLEGDE